MTQNTETSIEPHQPPGFWRRARAAWIDLVLLASCYLVMGHLSETLFHRDAYPPPKPMQLYSERDFAVYLFFVIGTFVLVTVYMLVAYTCFRMTLGQRLAAIRVLPQSGGELPLQAILLRLLATLSKVFLILVPGPLVALLFFIVGAGVFNPTLSLILLLAAILALFYGSMVKYERGKTRSFGDRVSGTIMVDARR